MKGKLLVWDDRDEDSPIKEVVLDMRMLEIIKDHLEAQVEWTEDWIAEQEDLPAGDPDKQPVGFAKHEVEQLNTIINELLRGV